MEIEEFKKISVINEFINYITKKNYSINTLIAYIDDLYYFYMFVKKDLVKVKEDDIRDYLEYLKLKKESAITVRRKISSFKTDHRLHHRNHRSPGHH